MHRTTTDLLAKLEAFGARSEALYGANSQLEDESGDEEEEEPLSPARWAGYEHTGPANDYAAELVERLGAAEHRPAVDVREDSRRRPQRALEKENLRASREAKPPPPGACLQINARSRELEREGDVGERLYEEARAKADRQEVARAAVERRRQESEAVGQHMPEINEVSALLMREREGNVASRLYAHAGLAASRAEDERQQQERSLRALASRPKMSASSSRIVAELPGREGRIEDRLVSQGEARQAMLRSQAAEQESLETDARQPQINQRSRLLAEKARAEPAAPRSAATSTELLECVHQPTIDPRSKRLAEQREAREGGEESSVEQRLQAEGQRHAAAAAARVAEEERLHAAARHPSINPESERLLQRRGPAVPLEVRMQQGVRHFKDESCSAELEECSHTPRLSSGSQRLLAAKPKAQGDVAQRLQEWGEKHARKPAAHDPEVSRYSFGPGFGHVEPP